MLIAIELEEYKPFLQDIMGICDRINDNGIIESIVLDLNKVADINDLIRLLDANEVEPGYLFEYLTTTSKVNDTAFLGEWAYKLTYALLDEVSYVLPDYYNYYFKYEDYTTGSKEVDTTTVFIEATRVGKLRDNAKALELSDIYLGLMNGIVV